MKFYLAATAIISSLFISSCAKQAETPAPIPAQKQPPAAAPVQAATPEPTPVVNQPAEPAEKTALVAEEIEGAEQTLEQKILDLTVSHEASYPHTNEFDFNEEAVLPNLFENNEAEEKRMKLSAMPLYKESDNDSDSSKIPKVDGAVINVDMKFD